MIRAILFVMIAAAAGGAWWKRDDALRLAAGLPHVGPYFATAPLEGRATTPRAAPAVPVVIARAQRRKVPVTIDAVGTVQSMASISIKPRIDSQIVSVQVQEGALVKAGDLLFRLDDRSLKAQLAQADAVILRDRAQLEQARRDLVRFDQLLTKSIGTEVQRDAAATALKVQQAQLAADQANRDNLAALLSYTEIRAPVSGRIGSIALKIGTSVRIADTQAIAIVNQIDPVFVSFAIPQSLFNDLRTAMAVGKVAIEAQVGTFKVPGIVSFVENTVDLATGTVLAKAEMSNGDERLWPGAFVAVQATLSVQSDAISIPSAAVQIGQQGAYVFVLRDDKKVALRPVVIARTSGNDTVIAEGLKGGEDVVIDGQLRLVDGTAVQVQPGRGDGVATGTDPGPPIQRRS